MAEPLLLLRGLMQLASTVHFLARGLFVVVLAGAAAEFKQRRAQVALSPVSTGP